MNSTRRVFATAAVLTAVIAPQASAQSVDLRSPDGRDGAVAHVDLRSPDASAPFEASKPASASSADSSSDAGWLIPAAAGLVLVLGAATATTTRRRRGSVPISG